MSSASSTRRNKSSSVVSISFRPSGSTDGTCKVSARASSATRVVSSKLSGDVIGQILLCSASSAIFFLFVCFLGLTPDYASLLRIFDLSFSATASNYAKEDSTGCASRIKGDPD